MAFEERTEQLMCPTCGAQHLAKWFRIPVREEFKLDCLACGGTLHEGKSILDYFEVKLIAD